MSTLPGADRLLARDLPGFAAANGLSYDATAPVPASAGGLWEQVSRGVVRDRVAGPGWEAGRITGGARSATSVEQRGTWTVTRTVSVSTPERSFDIGYLAITLPRRLPHMILDGRSNDRGPFSSMRERPRDDQRIRLEGDVDSHFRLYAPAGYEPDALYVFTPDLLALLIDEAGDLDVEVRDDRLLVSWPDGADLYAPATWERFARIRETIGRKTWQRTDMYQDERAGTVPLLFEGRAANEVAAEGRRLRRRVPRGVWIGVGIAVGVLAVFGTVTAIVLGSVASVFLR